MNAITHLTPLGTAMVAGGAGFVGSHLCDRLLDLGYSVLCVDSFLTGSRDNIAPLMNHPRFKLIEHDICDPLDVDHHLDLIFNLACAASPPHYQADPVHTMMTSVVGTGHLLTLAARNGARFLQASTSEVYGDPEQHPQREDYVGHVNCTGPRACYDEGKRAAESLCFDTMRAGEVDTRVARIFNTYGPRMRPDDGRIISNLVVQALSGKPLTIYGSGEQTRSFCYVSDLVEGLLALMLAKDSPGGPVNLGNPGEFTINQLADLVLEQTGSSSRKVYMPLPKDDPQRRRPDITKAKTLLNWEPRIPLAQGLSKTIAHFALTPAANPTKATTKRRRATAGASAEAVAR